MRKIATLYGGHAPHFRTFHEPKINQYLEKIIYLPHFRETDLVDMDILIVPSQLHLELLLDAAPAIHRFAELGGIVVAFGPQPIDWIPNQNWELRPTNFWWWLEDGADSGLRLVAPEYPLFRDSFLDIAKCTWHQHGVFHLSEGMESLIDMKDGGSLLYVDKVSTNGTWIVTTLDPDFHFGSYFMPATEQFLMGFIPWLASGEI
ncbi:hypothetical protein [Lysinibacillus sp. SGAir0095]|uniref:hypothetical protein n=1 Tax=Lysinibacillus sp. SGAir0095 TaxID=2070463 RepID=UPI0010CD0EE7|nr:hypothetical protein [Lysinibacillus sp. SGAir0095]QCR33599.1 hypothetical protein C1N55_16190 [Lysinibacillus sp. SGAir0095]